MGSRTSSRKDDIPNGISLLISILVRYPEIGTINFNPRNHTLKFIFLMTKVLPDSDFLRFKEKMLMSLETLGYLENRRAGIINLERSVFEGITQFEIIRDVDSLTREEISLIIQLFRQEFPDNLVADYNDNLIEEDLQMQEELIENMLEDLRVTSNDKNFIAFREEGRVLVFNK